MFPAIKEGLIEPSSKRRVKSRSSWRQSREVDPGTQSSQQRRRRRRRRSPSTDGTQDNLKKRCKNESSKHHHNSQSRKRHSTDPTLANDVSKAPSKRQKASKGEASRSKRSSSSSSKQENVSTIYSASSKGRADKEIREDAVGKRPTGEKKVFSA